MGQLLDFHVDIFRYIARPLVTPAPIYFRAQLDQHRQTFEAAAGYAPEQVWRVEPLPGLSLPGQFPARLPAEEGWAHIAWF